MTVTNSDLAATLARIEGELKRIGDVVGDEGRGLVKHVTELTSLRDKGIGYAAGVIGALTLFGVLIISGVKSLLQGFNHA